MDRDPRARRGTFQQTPRTSDFERAMENAPVSGATAAQMAARRFGGATRVQSDPFTLTTSLQTVLGPNPKRVYTLIINRGIVAAAVDIDSSMTFANGIILGQAGGFVTFDVEEDGETVGWPIFGLCESSTCVIRVLQVMRV